LQNYANTCTSAGAVSSMRLGNGKFENTTFNSRLQPIQIGLGSSATSQNLLKLNFDYGVADNNGNVKSQQITVQQGNQTPLVLNQTYMYDSLNRLKSAEEKDANNAQVWKQTYVFDRYGNRNFDAANNNTTNLVGTLPKVTNPEILPANNRLKTDQDGDNVVDYLYDASGNLTKDVDNKRFGYDAENKQVQYFASNNQSTTPNGTYFFDGDGKRVKKISPTETTIFVYDAGGKLVAEYSTQQADTPKINYTTNDHLGSPRITTDQNGQVISRSDYQPYGEEIASTQRTANLGYTVQDSVKQGFTGYIKDDETGLDYAQARMYKKELGRFTGVDPILITLIRLLDPQRINLYAYVRNNPTKYKDPQGKDIVLGTQDKAEQQALKQALAVLAKTKSGQEFLSKMDKSDVVFSLTVGKAIGTDRKQPGSFGVENYGKTDKSKLEGKGETAKGTIVIEINTALITKAGEKNEPIEKFNKNLGDKAAEGGKQLPFPGAPEGKDATERIATLVGHELNDAKEVADTGKAPDDSVSTTAARSMIKDPNKGKEPEKFVDELIKPKKP
jgi:RHS repeat-associated protein